MAVSAGSQQVVSQDLDALLLMSVSLMRKAKGICRKPCHKLMTGVFDGKQPQQEFKLSVNLTSRI